MISLKEKSMADPLLKVDHVTISYNGEPTVQDVSFELKQGEILGIVGESGSGKTTLSKMLLGLISVTEGEIDFQGKPRDISNGKKKKEYWKGIQAIFQDPFASYNMFKRVDSVLLDCINMRGDKNLPKEEKERLMTEACSFVNLKYAELTNKYPFELSGGQMQRVAIARALATDPEIIYFDEPTSALDPELTGEVLGVMRQLAKEGMTMLVVTHEMGFARNVSNKVVFMENGVVVEEGPSKEFFANPREERTRTFLQNIEQHYE